MPAPVAFILGGGPRIGWSVATKLQSQGYSVALGSRNPDKERAEKEKVLPVSVDVANTQSVQDAFETVKQTIGVPGVVVYNAAALSFPSDPSDPFGSITPDVLERDTSINAFGAYTALRESVQGFRTLSSASDAKLPQRVFIATGNVTPFQPLPMALTLAVGKSALVHMLQLAVDAYKSLGFRFYFASQVTESGGPVPYPDVDADAHAKVYWDLINQSSQGEWDVRFLGDGKQV